LEARQTWLEWWRTASREAIVELLDGLGIPRRQVPRSDGFDFGNVVALVPLDPTVADWQIRIGEVRCAVEMHIGV
jgi:hypothetical protein